MTNSSLVSIITPSYNQGEFIEETILSVKKQTYPYIEHIIVDGGSEDDTLQILRKYEETYNMRWLSEPDDGQADAINKGFQLSHGDILCWLNSDDIYVSPQVISKVQTLFQEYPHIGMITGGGVFLAEDGRQTGQFNFSEQLACYEYLRCGHYILQPATFFRKETLTSAQLDTSLHYAFDWDLFIQLTQHYAILAIDEIWAGYRLWGDNKTIVGGVPRVREMMQVTGRYLGKWSWQYWLMGLYYNSYRVANVVPKKVRYPLIILIRKISIILSKLSGHRVTTIT